jgi:hypothetical protein
MTSEATASSRTPVELEVSYAERDALWQTMFLVDGEAEIFSIIQDLIQRLKGVGADMKNTVIQYITYTN